MTSRFHLWMTLLCLAAVPAQAQDESARKVTVDFRGPLKEGLRAIAVQGGINLIVTGELDQPSEVYLREVSAEEALDSVAAAYQLKVHRQGAIWTLRPMTEAEKAASTSAQPLPTSDPPPALEAAPETTRTKRLRADQGSERQVSGTGPVVVEAGQVVQHAVSYGGSVNVRSGAVVEGDAVAFGGDVVVEDDAVVEGDAVSFGGRVVKAPGAVIEGEEVSMGTAGLGAVVGQLRPSEAEPAAEKKAAHKQKASGVPSFLLRFALLFGLGFLFLMFAPGRMKQIEAEIKQAPVRCGFTGLLGSIALVPLTLLLVVTVVGIPFAAAAWLLVGLGLAMGFAGVASELGVKLPFFRGRKTQAAVLAIGSLALLLAAEIPVLGPIAMTAVGMVSLGAIIRTRFGATPKGLPQVETSPALRDLR